ncbi:MAG: sodium:alanine symporter family protein [Ignavibacteria bacterium]|jgi:AGCS family alanine or glycine:cation symporter
MLLFILGSGIYFSIRLKGIQFLKFKKAIKAILGSVKSKGDGNISPYQALMSALSGIVGNGNIAGVATAIVIGGPGAVFWMWISALILMATMYAESLLGFKYREKDKDGTYIGGPMVYILKGKNWKWLAYAFAFAMAVKTLIATTSIQSNSMSIILNDQFGIPQILSCIVIALLTWIVIVGGLKKIAVTAQFLSPIMTLIYLSAGLIILIINYDQLLNVFNLIISSAFTEHSASGGFAGATVLMALRYGAARGAYSNEAGTGSVAIMHATAKSDNPVRQSLISMMGVFIDTIIVCSITAFVILISGNWTSGLNSTALASGSFNELLVYGNWVVLGSSLLFGYSTLITWCFYGEQCAAFMLGDNIKKYYRWAFTFAILIGALSNAENIWSLGDLLNGLTVIINLIGIIALGPIVIKTTLNYRD